MNKMLGICSDVRIFTQPVTRIQNESDTVLLLTFFINLNDVFSPNPYSVKAKFKFCRLFLDYYLSFKGFKYQDKLYFRV